MDCCTTSHRSGVQHSCIETSANSVVHSLSKLLECQTFSQLFPFPQTYCFEFKRRHNGTFSGNHQPGLLGQHRVSYKAERDLLFNDSAPDLGRELLDVMGKGLRASGLSGMGTSFVIEVIHMQHSILVLSFELKLLLH